MDTHSITETADMLGVGRATVRRHALRLGLDANEIDDKALASLRGELGQVHQAPGLTRDATKVLAALALRPLGLRSIRAVARVSGVSPTTATKALRHLESRGLAITVKTTIAEGRAVNAEIWFATIDHPNWTTVAEAIRQTTLPQPKATRPPVEVPPRLRHIFWNAGRVQIAGNEDYIAGRLLSDGDLQGLAWGSCLPASAWRRAAQKRGLSNRQRALALNMAAAAP